MNQIVFIFFGSKLAETGVMGCTEIGERRTFFDYRVKPGFDRE